MEYAALYRKHRPETFDDVVGQEHIIAALKESSARGRNAHAYLFHGSRGTGKTSVARILSRAMGVLPEDLYEIDAASNRGIDDIRELREGVRSLPFRSPHKAYIIDECQMLTKEAWGALLKTLEEPPKHVVFMLATTEIGKVPETIISRCETHTFRKPSQRVLKRVVEDIAQKEGRALGPSSADLVALLGDGSFRDALGILQLVFNGTAGEKITQEDVERVTNAPSHVLVNECLKALADGTLPSALESVRKATESAVDFKLFLKLILKKMRLALLFRYAPKMKQDMTEEFSEDEMAFIEELTGKKEHINSHTLLELLDAYTQTPRAHIPQLPLELALIKILGKEE